MKLSLPLFMANFNSMDFKNSKSDSKSKKIEFDESLPHYFLGEQIILSSLLFYPQAIERTIKNLSIDSFYFKNHQEFYKAILDMDEKKIPIDVYTLTTFLQDNGRLYKVGGLGVINELLNKIPNIANLEAYIRIVKERYIRRLFIKFGLEIVDSSYATNIPIQSLQNSIDTKLSNLYTESKSQTNEIPVCADIVSELFSDLKENFLKPKLPGLTSGFSDLDAFTQGFQKSDLIILAGRPSMGKTALALNLAVNAIKLSKLPVVLFSLEMSKEQIVYRLLSMETKINQMRLKSGKLSKNDWIKLNQMLRILAKLPFFIDDTFGLSVQEIRSKIRKIHFEHKEIGLIIIDYIQLMKHSSFQPENRAQELSQITRSLKEIAREFNIPIIGLSQLSRNLEHRADKRPILSDLRDSGSIEQDADLVLMLHKKNQMEQDIIELILAKHRNGPTGSIDLQFHKEQMKFFS